MDTAPVAHSPVSRAAADPECDFHDEIRFAVVMYGGVSLAIYINGIAQELLNMVYATAAGVARPNEPVPPLVPGGRLQGAQPVYRKIAQCLHDWHERSRPVRDYLAGRAESPQQSIRTRFVVDIISGTSAGGINGIFLAKALANRQLLEGLKKLWVDEGDIGLLINDRKSLSGIEGMAFAEPQVSLLNSQRMYRKLLEAFDQMGPERAEPTDSPLVDELDLFVTTTDIQGLPLPIRLTDKVVYERRHRNVFHFQYRGAAANDFQQDNDAFLAYAARCTSSFPFAFEPMRLADIDAVTRSFGRTHRYARATAATAKWDKFYSEYWRLSVIDLKSYSRYGKPDVTATPLTRPQLAERQEQLKEEFRQRAFGDGGYLDNKPFTYATSLLARRHADVPVFRKLLYIEPAPEHPEDGSQDMERPNFAGNVRAALLDLPTRETIREDIERVLERNALLSRISVYTRDIDADIARCRSRTRAGDRRGAFDERSIAYVPQKRFASMFLGDMVRERGITYGAYHRLRVDDVTAMLASLISRAAQHDSRSGAATAIRAFVDAWREIHYKTDRDDNGSPACAEFPGRQKQTENRFLLSFDIHYYIRRLAFIGRRINELQLLDLHARKLLDTWIAVEDKNARDLNAAMTDETWRAEFRNALRSIKKAVNVQMHTLRTFEESLARADSTGETILSEYVDQLDINWSDLETVLTEGQRRRADRACAMLHEKVERIQALQQLAERIDSEFEAARAELTPLVPIPLLLKDTIEDGAAAAYGCAEFYFRQFHLYDLVLFPLQYGTDSSETSEVEIFRISPEDATAIIDERHDTRKKLAGTVLMNFGAFLEKRWRKNDILWGRLDGAERLITAVLPLHLDGDELIRDKLIRDAQEAILEEDVVRENVQEISRQLGRFLAEVAPRLASDSPQFRAEFETLTREMQNRKAQLPNAMQAVLQQCLGNRAELWTFYRSSYDVNRRPDAEGAVRAMARATHVTARMFEGLATSYRVGNRPFRWIATFASIFWGIVEMAVPHSLPNILWRHWIKLFYVIDVVLILGGGFMGNDHVTNFGWAILAVTVATHGAVTAMGHFMTDNMRGLWVTAVKVTLVIAAIAVAALLGMARIFGWVFGAESMESMWRAMGPTAWGAAKLALTAAVVTLAVLFGYGAWKWIVAKSRSLAGVWHRSAVRVLMRAMTKLRA